MKDNFNGFMECYFEAYYKDGGMLHHMPKSNSSRVELMFEDFGYTIPTYNPLMSSFTMDTQASILMNTIELQRIQRELFLSSAVTRASLQDLMNKQAEVAARGLVIEA